MEKTICIHSLFGLNSKSKTPAFDPVTASSDFSRGIQNRKLSGIFALALILAMYGTVAQAQQSKIPHIGWLGAGPASVPGGASELFLRELGRLGYVNGKNVAIEYRYATNKLDRLPELADELVRLKVDLLVTGGSNAALAAKNATTTIPIVFYNVASDPVTVGLVESLAQPGGNITGMTTISGVLGGKRLELLKETIPKIARVAVLWDAKNSGSAQQWKESQLAARELGMQLYSMRLSSADNLESAFQEAAKAGSDAFTVTQNPLITSRRKQVVDLAGKSRLPAMYHQGDFVESGGLMSYGSDQTDSYRRAALIADRILKGAKPADLPVERPTKFELVINLKTAKQIGLTIPPNVLARADRVIK
jgi:putative tryptophan/tyrosine transport system substrate-binding protein